MALQCILIKIADNDKTEQGELLEAVLSLIDEQAEDIDSFTSAMNSGFTLALSRIASKNIGAAAMAEKLLQESDIDGELIECLLTLIQCQCDDIHIVRRQCTEY